MTVEQEKSLNAASATSVINFQILIASHYSNSSTVKLPLLSSPPTQVTFIGPDHCLTGNRMETLTSFT